MSIDRKSVSFAEAEGKVKIPAVLRWGELDQRLRAALWNQFFIFFSNHIETTDWDPEYWFSGPLRVILIREHTNRRHQFLNTFRERFRNKETVLDNWANFFTNSDYVGLFDFITFFLRDDACPNDFREQIQRVLDSPWSPYKLILSPPTIIPATSEEEAKVIKKDLHQVFASPFEGAKTHLQASLDALTTADHRSVVREAINAVESAVREYTKDPNAVLSKALKTLASEGSVHKALADAFEKLYAYTSDEKGIRHALVFEDNTKVGFDEALFFVSACSAFIAFLSRKVKASAK